MQYEFEILIKGNIVVRPAQHVENMTREKAYEYIKKYGKNVIHKDCDISDIRNEQIVEIKKE